MSTLRGWVVISLSAGISLMACGRSTLSVGGSATSGSNGGTGGMESVGGAGGVGGVGVTTVSVVSSVVSSGFGGGPICTPTPEACDGLDNDCDGEVDEGCLCTPGSGELCYSGPPETLNVGVCHQGKHVCNPDGLGYGPCMGEVTPGPEVCNGLDDNCDNGLTDEGCTISGCSDGTREGFTDANVYPQIAGCSGGFSVPGLLGVLKPACGFKAGNSGSNPSGFGCSAADLCAPGFHVCRSAFEVKDRSPTGCDNAAPSGGLFFATGQSGSGCAKCSLGTIVDSNLCNGCTCEDNCAQTIFTANDLFGCGSIGTSPNGCGVLDRTSGDLCNKVGPTWSCGIGVGCDEAVQVTKTGSAGGGVLCCAD